MKNLDKKIENISVFQEEMERRTQIERETERLICEGKHQEAVHLMNTLDDSIVRKLAESE